MPRPYDVSVPAGYDSSVPAPLVVLLHGYGWKGKWLDDYIELSKVAGDRGMFVVVPDGTIDSIGRRFWNATDACCDLGASNVDDDAYLMRIISEVRAEFSIDPRRIYFTGHSNGGFMSYRMACRHSDLIAAIVSVAGAMPLDQSQCPATHPVSILQVHGTADGTILYDGGSTVARYPSAAVSVGRWVATNGCSPTPVTTPNSLDLDSGLAGSETTSTAWSSCDAGTEVALWTIAGGQHSPSISTSFTSSLVDFLLAHPKP